MIISPFHKKLTELLSRPPAQGEGHRMIFRLALHLRHYWEADKVVRFLVEYTSTWERAVPEIEITRSVAKAFSLQGNPPREALEWPQPNPKAIAQALQEAAPIALADTGMSAYDALHQLWTPAELVCAGRTQGQPEIRACKDWKADAESRAFIVPSAMSCLWGQSEGKESQRCNANTGLRQWLVVELDWGSQDDQAKILGRFAEVLPLKMVVHSGNKSLHGWFDVRHVPEWASRTAFSLAVMLGADAHTWTRCQWVRMPGGTRDTGERQRILHWRPE